MSEVQVTESTARFAGEDDSRRRVLDLEEMVRRQLVANAPNAAQGERLLADEFAKRRFSLRGLSSRVKNPQYAAFAARRASLADREAYVRRQRDEYDQLFYARGIPGPFIALQELDAERISFLEGFRPPQTLSLYTPADEAARLTRLWRAQLGEALNLLFETYASTGAVDTSFGTRNYAEQLLGYHVKPIIDRREAELAAMTFEDMPLTAATLRQYFDEYVDMLATSIDETTFAYLTSALASHANRDYRAWWQQYKAANQTDDALRSKVERFIDEWIRAADGRAANVHAHRPLSWEHYRAEYTRLVMLEIADHRIKNLPTADELRKAFERFLSVEREPFPRAVLLNLPLDVYLLLQEADENTRAPGQSAARYDAAQAEIQKVWPGNAARFPHSPEQPVTARIDATDTWSPYDLSYPIARDLSAAAAVDIGRDVSMLWAMFDGNAAHDRAETRRRAFDTQYANLRLRTELSQVNYLLKNVLTEEIEVGLRVQRMVYDTVPLVLTVQLDLSPELAARIKYVPPLERRQADREAQDALADLSSKRFRVTWYHRTTAGERVAQVDVLDRDQTARLSVLAPSAGIEALDAAGEYRAVAQELDAADQVVGPEYRSVFTAAVVVHADCIRCRAPFSPLLGDPGVATHRECRWHPPAPDEPHSRQIEALRILVTHGRAEYDAFVRTAADRAVKYDEMGMAEQAPWGASTMQNLQQMSQLDSAAIHQLFSLEHIIGRFVTRFANVVRAYAIHMPNADDLAVLGLIAGIATSIVPGQSPTLRLSSAANLDQTQGTVQEIFVRSKISQFIDLLRTDVGSFSSADFVGPLDRVPLSRLVAALRLPFISAFQTPRERRYVEKLAADLGGFQSLYRQALAQSYGVAVSPAFDAGVAAEVARFGLNELIGKIRAYRLCLPPTVFYDDPSEVEFLALVRDLRPVRYSRPPDAGFWLGAHSYADPQPTLAALGARGAGLPRKLWLARRGSEPEGRGYDYAGLTLALVRAVERHVAVPSAEAYDDACRLVTVYNYFAFIAPALPPGAFMKAADILPRIRTAYFGVLFPPTPPIEEP